MNTPKEIAIITVAGIAIMGLFGWPVLRTHRARQWPHAVGKVTAAEVTYKSDSTGDTKGGNYTVSISYEYSVAGTKYSGKRVSFFDILARHSTRDTANAQLKRYAEGSMIKILYNPQNPADAVLETAVSRGFYFAIAFGAIFFAGGLFTLFRVLT